VLFGASYPATIKRKWSQQPKILSQKETAQEGNNHKFVIISSIISDSRSDFGDQTPNPRLIVSHIILHNRLSRLKFDANGKKQGKKPMQKGYLADARMQRADMHCISCPYLYNSTHLSFIRCIVGCELLLQSQVAFQTLER
jgi:hypothetical protein